MIMSFQIIKYGENTLTERKFTEPVSVLGISTYYLIPHSQQSGRIFT